MERRVLSTCWITSWQRKEVRGAIKWLIHELQQLARQASIRLKDFSNYY